MKTPLGPLLGDVAVAQGTKTHAKREDFVQSAEANNGCMKDHSRDESSYSLTLSKIDQALHRLAIGTYGSCIECGNDISLARLEYNPAEETCQRCHGTSEVKTS